MYVKENFQESHFPKNFRSVNLLQSLCRIVKFINNLYKWLSSIGLTLRLSSSRSDQNSGQRVVSIWHGRWQYLSRHSHQHPVCPCRSSFSVSCHVLFGLPALLLSPSGLVVGSRRMCPTDRLRRVATVSCSAACPVRAITSSFVTWSRHEMPKNTPKASTVTHYTILYDNKMSDVS